MYAGFAYYYDRLMKDVDYSKWADHIEAIFRVNHAEPELVLDLGCGTGSFCIEMAKRGYEMIGVDISPEMLSCARRKCDEEGLDILFLNQDMKEFELYGTVDAIVCLLDSINYLTDKRDVRKLLRRVNNYLNPGGLFIFDINSAYKLEKVLGNNVFYSIEDDIAYVWQNSYDKKKKTCRFDLTFFVKQNGLYRRFDEVHFERTYSVDELEGMISASVLILLDVYDDLRFSKPSEKSERIFFVCRK